METENNQQIAFLDVLIKRAPERKCSIVVYRKNTHTQTHTD